MGVDVSVFLFNIREYEQNLLPAYRTFEERSDPVPLVQMLTAAIPLVKSRGTRRSFLIESPTVYQSYADVLTGKTYYNSKREEATLSRRQTSQEDMHLFATRLAAPALMALFCVPSDTTFKPEQDLSKAGLTRHLYEHSRWIEDYFTFAKEPSGPTPEITLGEWNRLFSRDEVQAFKGELDRVPVSANWSASE